MKTLVLGDVFVVRHRFEGCCEDWAVNGSCEWCRNVRFMTHCAECNQLVFAPDADAYEFQHVDEDTDECDEKCFTCSDPECLGTVVTRMTGRKLEAAELKAVQS
jgi:hypothetical protein